MNFKTGDLICIKADYTILVWGLGWQKNAPTKKKLKQNHPYYAIYLAKDLVNEKHYVSIDGKCYRLWGESITLNCTFVKVNT